MALSYVNGSSSSGVGSTTLTYAVDCTGADILLVGCSFLAGSATSVTYNGVAMTQLVSNTTNNGTYIYGLIAPATGSNNVVVTGGSSTTINSCAVAYSGASASGQPDASGSATDVLIDGVAKAITTVADNSWVIAFGINVGATTMTRSSTGTTRQNTAASIMFDSGVKTPAGSVNSEFTSNFSSGVVTLVAVSIKPSTTTVTGFFF